MTRPTAASRSTSIATGSMPVATVSYPYQVTSSVNLNGRSGPKTSAPRVVSYAAGSTVPVVCQTAGLRVGTTSVWNKLTMATTSASYYVSTPSKTTYSPPLPRCTYPFQVMVPTLNRRTGPGPGIPLLALSPTVPWVG